MTTTTALKLGQSAGVVLLCAGVTACTVWHDHFSEAFFLGALLYGGCRFTLWMRAKGR